MSVEFLVEDHVAVIRLNRPEAMNAVDPETRSELHDIWQRIKDDHDIRVAILTGTGDRAFCTGADLKKSMPPKESSARLAFGDASADSVVVGLDTDKPLVCAINGLAYGGGLELALACDIRIASDSARFALPEARIGSIPGAGGTQRLPRTVGQSDAMLMLLTGDAVDATTALRIGLVSKVVSPAALMDEAHKIASRIAMNAPLSVRAIKRLVRSGVDVPLAAAIESERLAFGLLRDAEDRIEGRKAFQEKRPPQFNGR